MDGLSLARILPALLVVGGGGAVAKGGTTVAADLIDTVKVVMTRYELSGAVKMLEADYVLSGSLPGTGSPKALSVYLQKNMKGNFGRDPGLDMWNNLYRLRRVGGGIAVVSYGPNGQRDECAQANADVELKSMSRRIQLARAKDLGHELQGGHEPPPPRDDDICALLGLGSRQQGGGGGGGIPGISSRDSPFRPIPK